MEETGQVAIFWDYENCAAPSSMSGYELVKRIRDVAHEFGSIKLLKAYTELSEQSINSSRSIALRSELQSSGVSITDCPHNGYKDVADQMIIADMLTFAMDNPTNPTNTTILLMSGDRDFSYALSVLRLRRYNVVVVAPSIVHPSLRAQASTFFEWNISILARDESCLSNAPQSVRGRTRTSGDMTVSPSPATSSTLAANHSPPSSSSGSCSRGSKEYSKLPNSVASSTVVPSSVAPPPCSTTSSDRSQDFSCPPEIEISPPGYSAGAIPNSGIDDRRESNEIVYKQSPSSSTLDPSPSITPSTASSVLSETTVIAPKPVFLPKLPPLPSFPRPSSAGPSFPETSYSLSPLAAILARRTTGRAHDILPDVLLSEAPSQPRPSPAPLSAYPQYEHYTAKAEDNVGGLSGGVMLSSTTSPGEKLVIKPESIALAPTPVHVQPIAAPLPPAPAPAPARPSKPIPEIFLPLLQHLERSRLKGNLCADRRAVAKMLQSDDKIYERAGCIKFKDFIAKAEKMGLIVVGGIRPGAWISIHSDLRGRIALEKA